MEYVLSILVYIAVIGFTVLLSFSKNTYSINIDKKRQITFNNMFVAGLMLVIFSGIRYDVGTDYSNYLNTINWINSGPFFYKKSIFFHYISKLIYNYNLGYYWFFLLSSTLTVIFSFKAIDYVLKEEAPIGILIFLLSGFYFYSFNGVRACIAISILFYSIRYLIEKRFVIYILLVSFAAGWHLFSLIFIPLYFVINRKILGIILITSILLIFQIDVIIQLLKSLIEIPIFQSYKKYFATDYFKINDFYFSLGILSVIVVAASVLALYLTLSESVKKKSRVYFNLYITGVFFFLLISRLQIFSRLMDFFIYFQIFAIPIALQKLNKNSKQIYLILVSVILGIILTKNILDPHRKLVPFKTVFTEYNHSAVKK